MKAAIEAVVTWIDENIPKTWMQHKCRTPSSRRRFLLGRLKNIVVENMPEEEALPEQWLEKVPAQLLERVSGIIAIQQETTPEEQALIDDHEAAEVSVEIVPAPQLLERVSGMIAIQQETTPEEQALSDVHEAAEVSVEIVPEVNDKDQKDNMEKAHGGSDDEFRHLPPPPPTFTLWPSTSYESDSLRPIEPPASSASSSAIVVPSASLPEQEPQTLPVVLSLREPEVEPASEAASLKDVERGVFHNLTVATEPQRLQWPWRHGVRLNLLPRRFGFWPWNKVKKRVTAFRNRVQGPHPAVRHLQRGAWQSMDAFLAAGGVIGRIPPVSVQTELNVLCEWLAGRPAMASRVASVEVVRCMTEWLPPGTWVCARLHEPADHPCAGRWNQVGWHGCSMNNLQRAVVRGLVPGWSCINEGTSAALIGIYLMGEGAIDLCSTYSVYTPLQDHGYYYAPYLRVRCMYDEHRDYRKHVARKAGRASQFLTYPDVSYISAVYFHVVSTVDMVDGDRSQWLNIETERPIKMELNVTESDFVLKHRSLIQWLQAKERGQTPEPADE